MKFGKLFDPSLSCAFRYASSSSLDRGKGDQGDKAEEQFSRSQLVFEGFTSALGGTESSVLRNSKSPAAGGDILVATESQPGSSVPQTGVEPTPCELPAEVEMPLPPILEATPTSSEGGFRHS